MFIYTYTKIKCINTQENKERNIEIETIRPINILSGPIYILLLLTYGLLLDLKESPSPQKYVHIARYMDISGKRIYSTFIRFSRHPCHLVPMKAFVK